MSKRRKHGLRRRRQATFLLLLSIIFMLSCGPFLWRMEQLRQAKSVYDVSKVRDELQWWNAHGGLLNKLELLKEANLWLELELNVESKDLESKLTMYQDERHRFWLFLYYLKNGKTTEAQNVLGPMGKTPWGQLGQGLTSLANGDAEESRSQLAKTETEVSWNQLPIQEQTLRHLILAQAAMSMGDQLAARAELEEAQKLEPHNPACLTVAFDVAVGEGQWAKAVELCHSIVTQTWRTRTTLFETKRAVLALHENNLQELTASLASLKELPGGDGCIDYVNGIQALSKGQQQVGKNLLERAMNSGLEGELKADAQKAVAQVIDRQKANQLLRSVVDENVE
ncbi:hypothetical protein [Desulfosporosinus sp. BG]|uniref:hypothetical protein n=1 Tax=Desulfosporosinus sp. BG TaxID=1633135 RepID=UPI0008587E92|nr:hypothetical protein [Desulfosporosinus sp. BG]ODA40542.1 TPR repeat protein [Desulfosporosinus sp. BG]